MQTFTLPLFKIDDPNLKTSQASTIENQPEKLLITQEKIIAPLTQILDQASPISDKSKGKLENSQSFTQSLNDLFPEQQYDEKDIKKTKEILGQLADDLSPELLSEAVAEMQFLAKSWLDEFEKNIFDGKTLNELLNEKGRL